MATPYSNHQKPAAYNVLLAGFFLLLTINVNPAQAISFNFTKFKNDGSLILQGEAWISSSGSVILTSHAQAPSPIDRALYATPVPIWDSTTGNTASFVTSFSFTARASQTQAGDGIVFFLAPWGTEIPNNSSGGNLGIVDGSTAFNPVVAVEFDTYSNPWDPNSAHIGIDVNSVISLRTVPWNFLTSTIEKVSIIYDSETQTLNVVVTNLFGEITTISQVVDLKAILPEKISVGFSATTSSTHWESHDIFTWSFTSTLNTNSALENINIASYA